MAKTDQYDDFGEKVGGARKDLWRERGLLTGDLSGMTAREAEKYVCKDNVWKKPDYQALIESGIPFDVVYFIKKVRDSLSAAPQFYRSDDTPEKRLHRQEQYIDTIHAVQAVMEGLQTREDALRAFDRIMLANGYMEKTERISGPHYTATEQGRENPAVTDKLVRALYVSSAEAFAYKYTRKAKQEQFDIPKDARLPKGFEIRFNDGKGAYAQNHDWLPNTFYVVKGSRILKTNLESREEAAAWVRELAAQRGSTGKKRFVPQQLAHVRREGPDYRHGADATGQDYIDAFGFRGGEFGNWMNQEDRRASLNMGFDALKDLAGTLNIRAQDISFHGVLSIAFGARGSGKAAAHYEPLRRVINLTKMNGAGSLAHEWWHGLDNFLGGKYGVNGMLSENPRACPQMKKLIDTIKYKTETPEQAAARVEWLEALRKKGAQLNLDVAMGAVIRNTGDEAVSAEYERLKADFIAGKPDTVERLSQLKKRVYGRVIPKNEREQLSVYEKRRDERPTELGRVETDYYSHSKRMSRICEKDGGYWESNTELTARAFATYVMDRLEGQSDYLVGHAESAVAFDKTPLDELMVLRAYPEGEERAAINAAFDELVAELKLQQYLTHADRPENRTTIQENILPEADRNGQLFLYPPAGKHHRPDAGSER